MLIGTQLEKGLKITLEGKIISVPYIQMSIELLNRIGVKAEMLGHEIKVDYTPTIDPKTVQVESDWSSASYYYSLVALSPKSTISISTYFENSLQGDSSLQKIYRNNFGVESTFDHGKLTLKNNLNFEYDEVITLDLNNTPDIAQTIAATCVGLGLKCHLTGLETLKIKETDRLQALQNELTKLGAVVEITEDTLTIKRYNVFEETPILATYNDHRMAMCMAPLAVKFPIQIENEMVVEKSYPTFWEDWKHLGFDIQSL